MADEKLMSEPHDRLTQIADDVFRALRNHPDAEGVKAVLMLDDGKRGGIVMHGYFNSEKEPTDEEMRDATTHAMTDLFMHLRAMFKAVGKELSLVGFGRGGGIGHG